MLSMILYVLVLGGIVCTAVYFFRGGFERVGAIRLPTDRDSLPSLQRLSHALWKTPGEVFLGTKRGFNWVRDKIYSTYDLFRIRRTTARRSGGYQPVRSAPSLSLDQVYEDNSLMDLEEY
jgi:hypothetical protein